VAETAKALGWRLSVGYYLYISAVFAVVPLLALATWLVYCAWVARQHPEQAAAIIAATGHHFPLKRTLRPRRSK
jgi:hypothetical protein